MSIKSAIITVVAVALMAVSAQAELSFAVFGFTVNDHTGAAMENGTALMVYDGNNNGVGSSALDTTFVWDSGDTILDRCAVEYGETYPAKVCLSTDIAGFTANTDHMYLIVFEKAFDANSSATPGAYTWYSVVDLGVAATASDGDFSFYPAAVTPSLQTVPEPATCALLVAGGLMAIRRRMSR
jgi:hypothetical protein